MIGCKRELRRKHTREATAGELKEAEIRIVPDAFRDCSLKIVSCQGGQPGNVPKRRRDGSGDAVVRQL